MQKSVVTCVLFMTTLCVARSPTAVVAGDLHPSRGTLGLGRSMGLRRRHRYMVLFAIDVATRKVAILGVQAQSNDPWMEQIARNVSGEGGLLKSYHRKTA